MTFFQGISEHMTHRRRWLHLRRHQDCDTVLISTWMEIDKEKTYVRPNGNINTVAPKGPFRGNVAPATAHW